MSWFKTMLLSLLLSVALFSYCYSSGGETSHIYYLAVIFGVLFVLSAGIWGTMMYYSNYIVELKEELDGKEVAVVFPGVFIGEKERAEYEEGISSDVFALKDIAYLTITFKGDAPQLPHNLVELARSECVVLDRLATGEGVRIGGINKLTLRTSQRRHLPTVSPMGGILLEKIFGGQSRDAGSIPPSGEPEPTPTV